MAGSPRDSLGLAGQLKDILRRLRALERGSNRSLLQTATVSADDDGTPLIDDASWHQSPSVAIIDIPAGFNHFSLTVFSQVGMTVSGTGNSWLGCAASASLLDADDNEVEPVHIYGGASPNTYSAPHPNGGPVAVTSFAGIDVDYPPTAVKILVATWYSLALGAQVVNPGSSNSVVNATAIFTHG